LKNNNQLRSYFSWRRVLNPFRWPKLIYFLGKDTLHFIRTNVYESIRLQLILTFVICFVISAFVASMSTQYFEKVNRTAFIDYSSGIANIDSRARDILNRLDLQDSDSPYSARIPNEETSEVKTEAEQIQDIIQEEKEWNANIKILILDLDGRVLYKSAGATETEVDLHGIIRNAMEYRWQGLHSDYEYSGKEYYSFYPIDLEHTKAYLVVSAAPSPDIIYRSGSNESASILFAFATFIFIFYWLTKKKTKYIEELAQGLLEISKGNLDYRVNKKSNDELGTLATNINYMAEQLQIKNEEERLAEKTKNELITNVSHDLRTPLTLIMGYLRLLKDKSYENEQQADHYLNIAFSKSDKLKVLIDDLFEYTKLSNDDVKLIQERVCINELLEQLLEEVVSFAEENDLSIKRAFTQEKLYVVVDPDKLIRVFENLLTNAVKYSHKPSVVKVLLYRELQYVKVCVINKGDPLSKEDVDRLFDRFYKVDASRSSETGGSGLGLAIAKSIVEYHNGEIWAESEGEEIRFWVKLKLA
jgi:signal transduction histidine kinase